MLTEIIGLPEGAIGFAASGVVTPDERKRVLEPQIAIARGGGKVRLLYMTGPDFAGYDEGAVLDEAVFGTRHFTDFKKIAFVSDAGPYDRAVQALDGLMPAALKVFRTGDIDLAKEWLAE